MVLGYRKQSRRYLQAEPRPQELVLGLVLNPQLPQLRKHSLAGDQVLDAEGAVAAEEEDELACGYPPV